MDREEKQIKTTDEQTAEGMVEATPIEEGVADAVEPVEVAEKENGHEETVTEALKEAIQEQAREDEQPQSSNFTLRKILGGDILSARLIRSQIWLIVLIVFFVVLYISNRYSVQKDLLEIDRLNTELKDAKYKALSSSSMLTEKSRESHVIELLKHSKDSMLKMPSQPPYIITVPKK